MTAKKSYKDARIPLAIKIQLINNLIDDGNYVSARIRLLLERNKTCGKLPRELAELKEIVDREIVPLEVRVIEAYLNHGMISEAYAEWMNVARAYPLKNEENIEEKLYNTKMSREKLPVELKPLRDEIATLLENSPNNNERGNGVALRRDYSDSMFEA